MNGAKIVRFIGLPALSCGMNPTALEKGMTGKITALYPIPEKHGANGMGVLYQAENTKQKSSDFFNSDRSKEFVTLKE